MYCWRMVPHQRLSACCDITLKYDAHHTASLGTCDMIVHTTPLLCDQLILKICLTVPSKKDAPADCKGCIVLQAVPARVWPVERIQAAMATTVTWSVISLVNAQMQVTHAKAADICLLRSL